LKKGLKAKLSQEDQVGIVGCVAASGDTINMFWRTPRLGRMLRVESNGAAVRTDPNPASAWGVVAVNGWPLVHLRVECAEVCAAAARCAGVEDP
jgi:hypothetical protein